MAVDLGFLHWQVKDLELRDAESASREVVRELDGLNLGMLIEVTERRCSYVLKHF